MLPIPHIRARCCVIMKKRCWYVGTRFEIWSPVAQWIEWFSRSVSLSEDTEMRALHTLNPLYTILIMCLTKSLVVESNIQSLE